MPLSSLNENQLKSATADMGYNLIIASAGTGKTSTIVGRIAYLIENGINPKDIAKKFNLPLEVLLKKLKKENWICKILLLKEFYVTSVSKCKW